MAQKRIFALEKKGSKPKYYTSVTRLCRCNNIPYTKVSVIKKYPKKVDDAKISVLILNPEDTKKGTYK